MAERNKLFAYLMVIVAASWMTEAVWLAGGLLAVLALCGRDTGRLLRRSVLTTLTFSGTVSLAYLGYVWWTRRTLPLDWLLTVNLRVLLMALLTFMFISRVNLFQALSFSRRLSFLLVLAMSQSLGLQRTLEEFRLGLASRSLQPPSLRTRYRAAANMIGWLLDRALANAHESAQALQSRGGFR
jgi:cobalt/nickel transport system permease protein